VATHTWSDAVGIVANAHFVAAIPNGVTVEVDQTGNAMVDRLLRQQLDIREGRLILGDAPGLGVELAEDVVAELSSAYGDEMADGNYSDLIFGTKYYTVAEPFEAAADA
jgi:L-alanine-DL-glutamate epimerase-like enolase superfamily enzyme